jgi:hypothetical protein
MWITKAYEREGYYAYSSIVGGFLHLLVGIISLSISRREIHGYKVPSTYTTNCLQVLYAHGKTQAKREGMVETLKYVFFYLH